MTPVGWLAWYTEGRRYSSDETAWDDLPDDGALLFVVYFDRTTPGGVRHKRILSGADYYFRQGPLLADTNDPPDEIRRRYPGAVIKRGKWTTDDDMARVLAEAKSAMTQPPGCESCS